METPDLQTPHNTHISQRLWSDKVPVDLLRKLTVKERNQQEIIHEIIATEREYVQDLQTLIDLYVRPLIFSSDYNNQNSINTISTAESTARLPQFKSIKHRQEFISQLFGNISQIHDLNAQLLSTLTQMQRSSLVIAANDIGGAIEEWMMETNAMQAYQSYAINHQLRASVLMEKISSGEEDEQIPNFRQFCLMNEKRPESRKLPIQSFLVRPITRLGRYRLLLESLRKASPHSATSQLDSESGALEDVDKCLQILSSTLQMINEETGQIQSRQRLQFLHRSLSFRQLDSAHYLNSADMLHLDSSRRRIVREGPVRLMCDGELVDAWMILLDSVLLVTRRSQQPLAESQQQPSNTASQPQSPESEHAPSSPVSATSANLSLCRHPVPTYLLEIEDVHLKRQTTPTLVKQQSYTFITSTSSSTASVVPDSRQQQPASNNYPIVIKWPGKFGERLTVYALTSVEQKQWRESLAQTIAKATGKRQRLGQKFTQLPMFPDLPSDDATQDSLQSSTVYAMTRFNEAMLLGTDAGVYALTQEPLTYIRILELPRVTQLQIVEDWQCLLVLSDRVLWTFPLDKLGQSNFQRSGEILCGEDCEKSNDVSFFAVGEVMAGLKFVAAVRSRFTGSSVKFFERLPFKARKKPRKSGLLLLSKAVTSVMQFIRKRIFRMCDDNTAHDNSGDKQLAQQQQRKRRQSIGGVSFKIVQEISVPCAVKSLLYLKNKICLGTVRGFEMVDLVTRHSRHLLSDQDAQLKFAFGDTCTPLALFRVSDNELLCCYAEYGVFVNRSGSSSRQSPYGPNSPHMRWIGVPQAFAYCAPHLFAFDPSIIEIRDVFTGTVVQVLSYPNIRHCSPPVIAGASIRVDDDDDGVYFSVMKSTVSDQRRKISKQSNVIKLSIKHQ